MDADRSVARLQSRLFREQSRLILLLNNTSV